MKNFSIPMALTDFVPVFFFAAAAIILMRDLHNKMSWGTFALFAAGVINITCAGVLKASYKLLYALGICDFAVLSDIFFPLQASGFLLAGVGILAMLSRRQGKGAVHAVAPPVFGGTVIFVGLMVLGLGLMDAVLCILAVRLKKPVLIVFFVLSFISSLGMGYLSSRDFTQASMNWVAEATNLVAQGALFAGTWLLHKNGLARLRLHGEERM